MRSKHRVLLVLSAASLWGCVTVGDHFHTHSLDRAAFELQCPKEQLQVVVLNDAPDSMLRHGDQVGVTGCGKRAVYVFTQAGWIANTASADEKAQPETK